MAIVASFLKTVAELLCNGATADDFFVSAADVLFAPLCKVAAAREDRARPDVESFLRYELFCLNNKKKIFHIL